MIIAAWNVNSLRARLPLILQWLKERKPDVVLFQETKVVDELFPADIFEDIGYRCVFHGQKSYNGVAILSKYNFDSVTKGIPGFDDNDARYIEVEIGKYRISSVYIPNGREIGDPHYYYKERFFAALADHVGRHDDSWIIGGDYNVAPSDADVYDPKIWSSSHIICSDKERMWLGNLMSKGLCDVFDKKGMNSKFTWWDYRTRGWSAGRGLRIDLMLVSHVLPDSLKNLAVDDYTRGLQRPSDHAPVWIEIDDI